MKFKSFYLGLTLVGLLSLPASGQVSGKIFHLKQPWQKSETDFGATPPAFEKGWVTHQMTRRATLEVKTVDWPSIEAAVRAFFAPETKVGEFKLEPAGPAEADPAHPGFKMQTYKYTDKYRDPNKKDWVTEKGTIRWSTDGKSSFYYEKEASNLNFDEPDPKERIARIRKMKPAERGIYSKGDASHLHRLKVVFEVKLKLGPNPVIEVEYRREYAIYAADTSMLWKGIQKTTLNMAVNGTRPDMDEGLNELLEPIENALSQNSKTH